MPNDKIRILPLKLISRDQPKAELASRNRVPQMGTRPTPEESHRLAQAFGRIRNPDHRAWLVEQAEELADIDQD